jgi:hypothetical protein
MHFAAGSAHPDIIDTASCAGCGSSCQAEFGSPAELLRHLAQEECCPQQQAWLAALRRCPECGRGFPRFDRLSSHIAAKHLGPLLELQAQECRWASTCRVEILWPHFLRLAFGPLSRPCGCKTCLG